jgi:teichuronic acid biosynthesis glycosyltransferase TuaC
MARSDGPGGGSMTSQGRHPLRVLVITNLYPSVDRPGRGTFIRSQVESLSSAGIETSLLVIDGWRSRLDYLRAVGRLRQRLRTSFFDLIHAHYGYSLWVALTQGRLPVVASFLGDDILGTPDASGRIRRGSRWIATVNRAAARRCAAVIVKSEEMRARLGDPRAHVVPNGVDLGLFHPLDPEGCRRELALDPACTHILFAGDPSIPGKGYALAARAVDLHNEQIGGGGSGAHPPAAGLHAVWGRPQEELVRWMNACDALLLTSWSEGSPNVVKEAMACNLPVVAVDVGDVAAVLARSPGNEVISRATRSTGGTAAALAAALGRALAHGPTRSREAMGDLSLPAVAARIRTIYEEALGRAVGDRDSGALPARN